MKHKSWVPTMNPYPYHGAANGILHCLQRGAPIDHIGALRDMLRDNPADLLAYVEAWIAEPEAERQARDAEFAEKSRRHLAVRRNPVLSGK